MWISKKNFDKYVKKSIQAMDEGERLDVLTTGITGVNYKSTGDTYISKNNYPTYTKQIQIINQMYNNETDYAGEILRTLIDTRISFIAGAGISIKGKQKTVDFITKFLKQNKMLKGSKLLDVVKIGEMEGKCLLILSPKEKFGEKYVKVENLDWYNNPYDIQHKNKEVEKVILARRNNNESQKEIKIEKAVYIKIGGSPDRINETPPKIANILTNIVNLSRAKYDMRGNNHLYARPQWTALTDNLNEAKALKNKIEGKNMNRNKTYVGTAKQVFYLEPSGKAQEVLEREILLSARIISMNTGIPIHWLAWPDLMSNRATAENMLEAINAATIQERLIYEEAITELIQKMMILATENGMPGAINDQFGFEVKLDLTSYANLKQISETWIPLAESGYISNATAMSLIPGVDPNQEKKMIEKEKEANSIMRPKIIEEEENDENDKEM